ncbi:hypothetical protein PIROE2DRAFT_68482 [Piromyces sp. E2]|nr:hypothetical protein PIROE2DRAFT_68482 [Piromyces sp. E2]|eukprot:OUM69921.1 hypothetical protein PIROE2DRAFT_68482 [Piromyces sp. E2]
MNFSHKQQHEVVNNYYHQRKQQQKCLSTQKSYKKKQNKTGNINSKIDNDLMNSKYNQKQIYILQKSDSQKGKEDKTLSNIINNEKSNDNVTVNSTEKEELNNKKNIENTQQADDKKKRQDKHYQNNTKARSNSGSTPLGIITNATILGTSSAPVTPTNTSNFKKQDNSRRNKNNGSNNTGNSNNRRYAKRDNYNEEGISKSNSRKSDEMTKSSSRNGYNKPDEITRSASKNGYAKKDEKFNQRNNNNKSNGKTDGRGNKKNDSNRNNYHQRNNQGSNNKREDGPGFAEKEYGLTYEKLKDNSSNDLNLATANKKHSYNSNIPQNPPNLQRRRSSAPELPFFFEQLSTDGGMMNSPNPINTSIANTPSVASNPANLNFNLINAAATASNTTTPNFANFPLNLNGLNGLNLLNGFNLLNGLNSFASPTTATPTTTTTPSNNVNAVVNNNTNANANNNSNDNSKSNNNSTINGHGGRFNHLYAGPTFNNSPAASSLPMPNFINRNNNDSSNGEASSSRLSRSFAEEYMKLPSQLYNSAEINNEISKNYVADDLVLYSKNMKKDDFFFNNQNNGINNFNKEDLFMRRDISAINTQNVVSGLSGLRNTTSTTPTPNKRNSYAEEVFAMDDEYSNTTNTPSLPLANGIPTSSNSPTKTKFKNHEDENLKRKSMELLQYLSSSVAANSANTSNINTSNNDETQKVQAKSNANQTSTVSSIKIRSYNNSSTSSTSSSYTNTNTTLINSNEDNSMFSTTPNSFYSPANKNMNSSLAPVISATTDVLSSSENSNSTLSLEQISQNLKNMLKIN